jgi:hypothetical protein
MKDNTLLSVRQLADRWIAMNLKASKQDKRNTHSMEDPQKVLSSSDFLLKNYLNEFTVIYGECNCSDTSSDHWFLMIIKLDCLMI